MCVDQERGRYLAVSTEDAEVWADSHTSHDDALGKLVRNNAGITVDKVVDIDEVTHRP